MQKTLDPSQLVFLDETWATTALSPARGWAPKGERLVSAVPHGHWHTTTFVCGLRTTGLVAPLVLDGAINGAAFVAYVEWGSRIGKENSRPGATPPLAAPMPHWGWGEAPPYG